jgi:hypothetical protein
MNNLKPFESTISLTEASVAALVDALDNFSGFSGVNCRICGKTANVLAGHPWSCACGGHNKPMIAFPLHEQPEFGPTAETIGNGIHKSQKWKGWEEAHYA